LEESLPLSAVVLVRLPGKLFAVESKQRASLGCKVAVVVRRYLGSRQQLPRAKPDMAIGADASCGMEVNPAALWALEVDRSRTCETEVLRDEDVLSEHACAGQVVQYVGGERRGGKAV
jgi:hypothetical protein